ncbi:MAG: histidinol-phosphatase [Bacilli bacterium]|nr:histidinol-phosphatase [Bacilli bacterium]
MRSWDYNYHSHTYRCGHATGQDEDYVLAAIKAGFKKMGFSDHVIIKDCVQPNIRAPYGELEGYLHSVDILRRRYRGVIDIYTGFEAEYSPLLIPYYKELLSSGKVDYLIQGQHSVYEHGGMVWYSRKFSDFKTQVEHYVDDCVKGMESGVFLYLAHPDFFFIFDHIWDENGVKAAKRIAEASIRNDIPLEVNMAKARLGITDCPSFHDYPSHDFWDIVSSYGCKVVFGVDAHAPREYTLTRYEVFEEFARQHHLNVINPIVKHSPLHSDDK